ncbi:ABC transporter ATP-binding protein [Halorubrum ezzemoulense]|uniref:Molybdate/tungstate import ATP-binding protein WtpC n=1 Tax=Halorubrum ezzemoulense TaxID=337243 RepID=A0A256IVP2_HALEZ|nr:MULTISPECIES: ABC transporter ATP-binding protein [Halorubrum]MDB2223869.1 ABC transporter ATP-binding protein [Halorubrum ezzemoulense]MDB2241294.1 ABC transporter ATP-binding protein [Halorubrum ezzemoulense]MDB2244997.1 ABC transporter ATP-binding protein [Halorubrum ezzemoulense]MDB2251204.1 ABC transporter ATP-binding protein [Halorubrum ezzemoulense]MDB2259478.1 ABC transporter ATP-binding protein [Halorubrum ezzemoulense]
MASTEPVGTTRSTESDDATADRSDDSATDHRASAAADDGATAAADPVLSLSEVTKAFGPETAVDDVSLDVRSGELLTFLGPSGCGKTTTLRTIAGLEEPTEGQITLGDEVVAGDGSFVPPERRDVGIVFQNFALFPHLTVRENIAFGLTDADAAESEARVDELLELVEMTDHGEKTPDQLSGGQKQRVALARSLAPEPEVLLLDEPFSNLDVRLRVEMREEVRRILKEAGVTAVSVTHDQEEALSISDRVAVMSDGRIEQVGRPESVFERPESKFVASFLGRASFLEGELRDGKVDTGIGRFDAVTLEGYDTVYDGAPVDVLVRPDDLRATPATSELADGVVTSRQYVGPSFVYRVELDSGEAVHCLHNHVEEFDLDEPVSLELTADHPLAWYPR